MADKSPIEWTDATANVVNGCSPVSPGCKRCFAMRQAHRTDVRRGLTRHTDAGMVWTGEVRFHERALQQVLSWRRPRRIFWNAHGDLFHPEVPDAWIDRIFAACALTPQHTHMILTKRSERMRDYLRDVRDNPPHRTAIYAQGSRMMAANDPRKRQAPPDFPLPNVLLGVSVEDQTRADERIPHLLATPAAVRFVSCGPLLGPINFEIHNPVEMVTTNALTGRWVDHSNFNPNGPVQGIGPKLDWVIAEGESGPGARPMYPRLPRFLRDQCAIAGVPFFFKQWGEWFPGEIDNPSDGSGWIAYPDADHDPSADRWEGRWQYQDGMLRVGKKRAGRLLDGVEHNGVPA